MYNFEKLSPATDWIKLFFTICLVNPDWKYFQIIKPIWFYGPSIFSDASCHWVKCIWYRYQMIQVTTQANHKLRFIFFTWTKVVDIILQRHYQEYQDKLVEVQALQKKCSGLAKHQSKKYKELTENLKR